MSSPSDTQNKPGGDLALLCVDRRCLIQASQITVHWIRLEFGELRVFYGLFIIGADDCCTMQYKTLTERLY